MILRTRLRPVRPPRSSLQAIRALRVTRSPLRRFQSSSSSSTQAVEPSPPAQGLWARSKQLARENGRIYTLTYLGLSAVDFSIVFAIILLGGGAYVRIAEDWVLEHLDWRRAGEENSKLKEKVGDWAQRRRKALPPAADSSEPSDGQHSRKGEWGSSLWTSAALAYGIHKVLLLPVRLGFTIALTPWIVRSVRAPQDCFVLLIGPCRTLRARGWNVGPAAAVTATPTATAVKSS
jgi:N-terminal acetyltransferase 2